MSTERRLFAYFIEKSDTETIIDRLVYLEDLVTELLNKKENDHG